MIGNAKCRQSFPDPWRTIIALVNAAKVMVIAASATQMPVLEAVDSRATRRRALPEPGSLMVGGGWSVVAIVYLNEAFVLARGRNLLRRILHDKVPARSFNAVLIGVVIYDRSLPAEIVPWWWRRRGPFKRCALP